MKKPFLILFTVLLLVGCATTEQAVSGPRMVQKIIEVEGTKAELYKSTSIWFAKSFESSTEVIQHQEEGIIIGRGRTYVNLYYVRFLMTVEIKDNKIRVTFEQFEGETTSGNNMKIFDIQYINQIVPLMEQITNNLEAHLGKKTEEW